MGISEGYAGDFQESCMSDQFNQMLNMGQTPAFSEASAELIDPSIADHVDNTQEKVWEHGGGDEAGPSATTGSGFGDTGTLPAGNTPQLEFICQEVKDGKICGQTFSHQYLLT